MEEFFLRWILIALLGFACFQEYRLRTMLRSRAWTFKFLGYFTFLIRNFAVAVGWMNVVGIQGIIWGVAAFLLLIIGNHLLKNDINNVRNIVKKIRE